ncbi:hypothetical protein AMJ51_00465 [Microgenomates bacterium DG_75]|nr:MAG: hypothetical protein AMJ51_00465 [Microgenomates bacterium DG_75]
MKKLNKAITQINLVLLAAQVLMIIFVWRFLPPEIPLFYSRPWGKDQLVIYPGIILLPVIGLFVFFTNTAITQLAAEEESLIKKSLAIASLVFTLLITISLVQIIRLII